MNQLGSQPTSTPDRTPAAGDETSRRHAGDVARPVRPAFITELSLPAISSADFVRPTPERRSVVSRALSDLAHTAIRLPIPVWVALDALLAYAAVVAGHWRSPMFHPTAVYYTVGQMALVHIVTVFLASYAFGLYGRSSFNSTYRIVLSSTGASIIAISATTLFLSWFKFVQIGRWVVFFSFVFTLLASIFVRVVAKGFAGRRKMRVLFVGDPRKYESLGTEMRKHYGDLYDNPSFLDVRALDADAKVARTLELFHLLKADEIVVEDSSELLLDLLHASAPIVSRGGVLRTLSAFHEDLLHETPIDIVDVRSLLGPGWGIGRQSTELVKRSFDVLLALTGILLSAPLMIMVAIAVKLTSRGPIIYKQERVGRFGTTFSIWKFRTMRADAEADGARWAVEGDERVTPIGRFLRKTRFDELPQLFNILLGKMSFVGPRPERPEFIAELEKEIPYYQLRHLVPPGLTGWAQIRYPYGASIEDAKRKLCYDLYYVRRYGLAFDLAVCLKTAVAMARGAR